MMIFHNNISYKTLISPKLWRIRSDKIDEFIIVYDGTRYLTLFGSENYDAIYNRIKYIKSKKQYHIYFFSLFCEN